MSSVELALGLGLVARLALEPVLELGPELVPELGLGPVPGLESGHGPELEPGLVVERQLLPLDFDAASDDQLDSESPSL